jgi:hypothetical protein
LRFLHLPSFFPIRLMLSDVPTAVYSYLYLLIKKKKMFFGCSFRYMVSSFHNLRLCLLDDTFFSHGCGNSEG